MMINPDEFPPQEEFLKNNIAHCPKILSQSVDSSGPSQLSQAEKVLNWQTENSLAQNQFLSTINHKVDQLTEGYNSRLLSLQNSVAEIHGRLGSLHQEMMTMAKHMMANTTQFRNKEAETTSLKSQLRDLQRCLEIEDSKGKGKDIGIIEFSMTSLLDNLSKLPESPDKKDQQPLSSQQPSSSRQITKINHYSDTSSSDYESESNDESLPKQFAIGEGSSTPKKEPDINEVNSSDEEMNYAPPREEIPTKQFSSKIMVFTFDDIPFENGMLVSMSFMHG
ncbi:hypothetical protein F2Q68_00024184 [Brassica cretica]|uniref:Uncharacterized protein n=1 Tax=Brassica cretica TaxID=69181 RepID=A0A8S9IBQ9_BRACR|nr:hypothetical protein F2Q68_00024184 [Brassica cretica]